MSVVVALAATPAYADLIRVTPTGFTPAQYEAAGFPTDPAIIGGDGFRLTYWGGGKDTLADPVMLVFAIPDGQAAPLVTPVQASGITLGNVGVGIATQTEYGGNWNTTTGSAGTFSST